MAFAVKERLSYPFYRRLGARPIINQDKINTWILCPNPSCGKGSVVINKRVVYPGSSFGPYLEGLPEETNKAYGEARRCMSISALTATELLCRKILMHVAVDKGAEEGDNFIDYVNYLEEKGFITPAMKGWVDRIRSHGNLATHVLEKPSRERAEDTLTFTAELLRIIYEMEFKSLKYIEKEEEIQINPE